MTSQADTRPRPRAADLFVDTVNAVSTMAGIVAAGMILIAVALTCQMIWIRFVLNGSTVWQTEAVVYLMIGATLIGLPYVQKLRGHVNVDLIPLLLGHRVRLALAWLVGLVGIALAVALTIYAAELWHLAWKRNWRSETVWGVKLWIPYLAMPLGFGLLALQYVADLVALATRREPPFGIAEGRVG